QEVVPESAIERVLVFVTKELVIAVAAVHAVQTGTAMDDVCIGGTGQVVVPDGTLRSQLALERLTRPIGTIVESNAVNSVVGVVAKIVVRDVHRITAVRQRHPKLGVGPGDRHVLGRDAGSELNDVSGARPVEGTVVYGQKSVAPPEAI